MANLFGTVDADGHLEENHIDWKERLPDKYKDQAPERRHSGNGQLRTIIEGKAWPRPRRTRHRRRRPVQPAASAPSRHDRSQSAPGRHGQRKDRCRRAFRRRTWRERCPRSMMPDSPPRSPRARNSWLGRILRGRSKANQRHRGAGAARYRCERERIANEASKSWALSAPRFFPTSKDAIWAIPIIFRSMPKPRSLNVPICVHMFLGPLRLGCHRHRARRQIFLLASFRPSLRADDRALGHHRRRRARSFSQAALCVSRIGLRLAALLV